MTKENQELFHLVFGVKLGKTELEYLKSKLKNHNLDIPELFITSVVCKQLDAARLIIDSGFDMNKEIEFLIYQLLMCSNYDSSMIYIDFYIQHGLIITEELLMGLRELAAYYSDSFYEDKVVSLIEILKKYVLN